MTRVGGRRELASEGGLFSTSCLPACLVACKQVSKSKAERQYAMYAEPTGELDSNGNGNDNDSSNNGDNNSTATTIFKPSR